MSRITDNWIVRNLLKAVLLVIAIALTAAVVLGIITQHNREYVVPDFTNLSFEQAQQLAASSSLEVEIVDSVFARGSRRGVVFSQSPKEGAKVKKGRCIALTTTAMVAKKVMVPSLVGCSIRQAKAELLSRDLVMGHISYVPDMATNIVLQQIFKGSDVVPGTEIEAGSPIDLVLGLNEEDNMTYMPNVMGILGTRAVDAIQDNSLNIGRMVFDESVKSYSDTLAARVYRQSPEGGTSLSMGSRISIFLTLNPTKLNSVR